MNKNKIYLTVAMLSLVGMLGQYMYYESIADAQSISTYTKTYSSVQEARNIMAQEEVKGCSKLHQDFTNKDGTNGVLTFTCDSREPIPTPKTDITREDLLQEIASERNYNLIGRVIIP